MGGGLGGIGNEKLIDQSVSTGGGLLEPAGASKVLRGKFSILVPCREKTKKKKEALKGRRSAGYGLPPGRKKKGVARIRWNEDHLPGTLKKPGGGKQNWKVNQGRHMSGNGKFRHLGAGIEIWVRMTENKGGKTAENWNVLSADKKRETWVRGRQRQ